MTAQELFSERLPPLWAGLLSSLIVLKNTQLLVPTLRVGTPKWDAPRPVPQSGKTCRAYAGP